MEVMKRAAIKMEEEEKESDGWEGNEQTRAGDCFNYTAETKTEHGWGGKVLRKRIRANKVLSGSLLTTVEEDSIPRQPAAHTVNPQLTGVCLNQHLCDT